MPRGWHDLEACSTFSDTAALDERRSHLDELGAGTEQQSRRTDLMSGPVNENTLKQQDEKLWGRHLRILREGC